jgi:RNA-dependent RNA polymerase
MFYRCSGAVHFVAKPESSTVLMKRLKIVGDKKKKRLQVHKNFINTTELQCTECSRDVGHDLPFGPARASVLMFGTEKLIVRGILRGTKDKWGDVMNQNPGIDVREDKDFYGAVHLPQKPKQELQAKPPIVFPQPQNPTIFDCRKLLTSEKIPKPEQTYAFVEGLLRDLIVVLPTGCGKFHPALVSHVPGKTLIASMILAAFRRLNPERLVVFVVDRVPLVFQQGQSVEYDTGLRMCKLCGETKSEKILSQLRGGYYDGLVATAGILVALLSTGTLDLARDASVIVFDECHHATGQHLYVQILESISTADAGRPRLIGLSASPVHAEDVNSALRNLQVLKRRFYNALVYKPQLSTVPQDVYWRIVDPTLEQRSFIESFKEVITFLSEKVNSCFPDSIPQYMVVKEHWYQLRGAARTVEQVYVSPKWGVEYAGLILKLLPAVDVNYTLGPTKATELCQSISLPLNTRHPSVYGGSPHWNQLFYELKQCSADIKALIFVDTREGAKLLLRSIKADRELSHITPGLVLGHGGADGMAWEGEQEEAIEALNSGKLNLIVSTSVLEEGLDVIACDLVIRFMTRVSLIKFVQSRGRARKAKGKMVVILSREHQMQVEKIQGQERCLDFALSSTSQSVLPSRECQSIISGLGLDNYFQSVEETYHTPGVRFGNCAMTIFVHGELTSLQKRDIGSKVAKVLAHHTDVTRVEHFPRSGQQRFGTAHIFEPTSSIIIAYLQPKDIRTSYIQTICSAWTFEIEDSKVWCAFSSILPSGLPAQSFNDITVQVGHFEDKNTFSTNGTLRSPTSFSVSPGYLSFASEASRIDLSVTNIEGFAVISADRMYKTITVLFPITSAPVCYASEPTLFSGLGPDMDMAEQLIRVSVPSTESDDFEYGEGNKMAVIHDLQLFARSSAVAITLPLKEWDRLTRLMAKPYTLGVPLFFGRVTMLEKNLAMSPELPEMRITDEVDAVYNECRWNLSVLCSDMSLRISGKSWIYLVEEITHAAKTQNLPRLRAISAMLPELNHLCRQLAPWTDLEKLFGSLLQGLSCALVSTIDSPKFVSIRCVAVTPSRVVPFFPILIQKSRLTRKFCPSHEIILVSFRDEQLQPVSSEESVLKRIRGVLRDGVTILGSKYSFLLSSASQLRSASAYFVRGSFDTAQAIRDELLPNLNLENFPVSKYLSRLSLFATADIPTINVPPEKCREIPDIWDPNELLLTDGCGLIGRELAQEVFREYLRSKETEISEYERVPAAFQFRMGGLKGVLLVDHSGPGDQLLYRPSMLKIENPDRTLCIVGISRFIPLKLNREVITLLNSLSRFSEWSDSYISVLHDQELSRHAEIFVTPTIAVETLMKYFGDVQKIAETGLNILTDPFWWSLARAIYQKKIHLLRSKTHIPVSEAALLMGACDPTGTLKDGEVFVKIRRDPSAPAETITGAVLVYRNPCLYPGDIQFLTAVSNPKLEIYENVAIFPVVGNSIPAACSGGDLDGDKFAVIWDEALVPPKKLEFPALNYETVIREATKKYQAMEAATVPRTLEDFFISVMKNDALGRVAHIHLALSDLMISGALDPLAIELAKSQSVAVDYPKTGIPPEVPKKALEIVKDHGYPDFMNATMKDSYVSEKLLGVLYRTCNSLSETIEFDSGLDDFFAESHKIFQFPGTKKFKKGAREAYERYEGGMLRIMAHFGVKKEAEVVLGDVTTHHHQMLRDKGKAARNLREAWEVLREATRQEFFEEFSESRSRGETAVEEKMRAKAGAWAQAAYLPKRRNLKWKEKFLSFAWIFSDIIVEVLPNRISGTAFGIIGKNSMEMLFKNSGQLMSVIMSKLMTFNQIKECLTSENPDAISVLLFGSVGMFLCEVDSDIDVYVNILDPSAIGIKGTDSARFRDLSEGDKRIHYLKTYVSPALSSLCYSSQDIFGARVPIVTCQLKENDFSSADVCADPEGFTKALYMHALYQNSPVIFPLFYLLTRWASSVGIIKSTVSGTPGLLKTFEFQALVFSFLDLVPDPKAQGLTTLEELLEKARSASEEQLHDLGKKLAKFFQRGARLQEKLTITWPTGIRQTGVIESAVVKEFAMQCQKAHHLLLASRNFETLLRNTSTCPESSFRWKLSTHVSYHLLPALEFHVERLKLISEIQNLTIEEPEGDSLRLVLSAVGTRFQLQKLRDELTKLGDLGNLVGIGAISVRTSAYFMRGSSFIFARDSVDQDCLLAFESYHGPVNNVHFLFETTQPVLRSPRVPNWEEPFFNFLARKIVTQLEGLPPNSPLVDTLSLVFRFGTFYTISTSHALEGSTTGGTLMASELEEICAKNKASRKRLERNAYDPEKGSSERKQPKDDEG